MLSLNILFWAFFAAYVVHLLDEALLNQGFVRWIVDNFWPTYNVRMFFWFNAGAIGGIAFSNVLYDSFGGHWIILPLVWISGFAMHSLTVHLYWTIRRNTYSPGLLSSTLYIVFFYLVVRYGLCAHLISRSDFVAGTVAGMATVGAFLTVGPTWLFPKILR